MPRLQPRPTIVEFWRIALLALGAAVFGLLAVRDTPSRKTYEEILTVLRVVDTTHASLQRDVLQSRAGLLRNYDPLVASVADLHASATKLGTLLNRSMQDGISDLNEELSNVLSAIQADEKLVEQFKTSNALLRNSLEIFGQLLGQLHRSTSPHGQPVERTGELGNLMMRFAADPSADLERRIRAELDALLRSGAGRVDYVRALLSHADLILRILPQVDETTMAIQASQTLSEAQILRERYVDAYENMSLQSARMRLIFGSISLALCGFIAMFVFRLRAHTQRLTQQLEFESILDQVNRRFGASYITMGLAVEDALDILGSFFEAQKRTFVIIDPESGEVQHAFGSPADEVIESLIAEARAKSAVAQPDYSALADDLARPWGGSDPMYITRGTTVDAIVVIQFDGRSAALLRLSVDQLQLNANGKVRRLLGQAADCLAYCVRSVRDREEREALLARLEHSQRLEAVGTLAGGIAHEFNNVLLAMMGYSEMALEASQDGSQSGRYIQEIIHSGQRAKLIIDQILAFSRKSERLSKPFDLCEAVLDVIPLLRVSLPSQISLETNIPNRIPAVAGHPIEVQQILINLCRNAAQACGEAGTVTISVSSTEVRARTTLSHGSIPPGSYAVLQVSDTGSGIDAKALPHIFDPFFTTRSETGGTGLGLAAVHGMVAGMAGHIDVQSRVNAGTRFDLYFPVTHRNPIAISHFLTDRPVPIGAGQTVLVAEGDQEARSMYEEKAAALGYEAIGVGSLDGLHTWLSKPNNTADLIIFDTTLWPDVPNLSNIVQTFSPTPIILLLDSANSAAIDRRSLSQVRFLRKPVTTARLAWAISTTLGEARWAS